MGSKDKLKHYAENLTFSNMYQPSYDDVKHGYYLRGNWRKEVFKNDNPIILELGCGKGEYTVGLGRKYPNINFIGMDIKGSRMWRGCKTSNEEELKNVAFLRWHVQMVPQIFAENELDELWITFPDPQPKNVKRNKRLTSQVFLERYAKILKPEGIINFKTDSEGLFDFTLEVIEEFGHRLIISVKDLYNYDGLEEVKSIKTFYEDLFYRQGFDINFMQFRLNSQLRNP
jgi:tRNA (guanine-N7-)-methyltransferase